ncbi:MAG: hypothetical protein PHN38_03420 [Sulfurospirillaceae bacterium]|nr:hypothetical protein [Sulfurospirillaceae bacterium]MDD3462433.1 hypothetical protein [Sulfurospirillaceae bacterium]
MQTKILGTFFTIIFVGILVLFYKLLNQSDEPRVEFTEYLSPSKKTIKKAPEDAMWVKELAQKDNKEFSFPVNELFMQIDLRESISRKIKSYKLVIDKADTYSLFCIVQTLSTFDLPYVIVKEQKAPMIYLSDKSDTVLKKIVVELEKYDIKSKIIEVWL